MKQKQERIELLVDAIESRTFGSFDVWTFTYQTLGGTTIIAAAGNSSDDGQPHDLLAVFPTPLDGRYTAILRPTVDPEFRDALEAALVARRG